MVSILRCRGARGEPPAERKRPIVNDLPFGYQVFVDDGSGETQIFIPASTGSIPSEPFEAPR